MKKAAWIVLALVLFAGLVSGCKKTESVAKSSLSLNYIAVVAPRYYNAGGDEFYWSVERLSHAADVFTAQIEPYHHACCQQQRRPFQRQLGGYVSDAAFGCSAAGYFLSGNAKAYH